MTSPLALLADQLAGAGLSARPDEPLHRHTVARLGGKADLLAIAENADQLALACQAGWAAQVPVRVVGGGANILFADAGWRGLIIVNHAKHYQLSEEADATLLVAESGLVLPQVARLTIDLGLAGFTWAVGVPGTIGGAAINNAGAHGRDTAANIAWAEVLTPNQGPRQWLPAELAYRAAPSALQAEAAEFTAYRKRTQPPGASLGSMFKNPPGDYAGRLIEAAGLKGTQIGGVMISPVHANFFVNTGAGTAADYQALIALAQEAVLEKFGVQLALEIELIG
jgi:UDP-N-acetylmuramate dehydrogenase